MNDSTLEIAVLAAEAVPYVKAGGLGDVAGALPGELAKRGHRVDLLLPLYRSISRDLVSADPILEGVLPFQERGEDGGYRVYEHQVTDRYRVLFIDVPRLFDRDGIYTDPATGKAFPDDGERFLRFTQACLETLSQRDRPLDLLHCNDYHSGLAPSLLDRQYRGHSALASTATVLSIHNLAYQGIFDSSLLELAGIADADAEPGSSFEYWGKLNFMKAGICDADLISTVSPRYAREITEDPEQGYGLEGLLGERAGDLVGILNGIDLSTWSPEIDPHIAQAYSSKDVAVGKRANRQALLAEFGLADEPGDALVGIVSRLVTQKGFDLFEPIMERLMALPLKLVILGTGEKDIESLFADFAKKYDDRLGLFLGFDNRLAHLIEAASDFFLMPSRYEPCGLNQLYSLRYGTLPIVRETGGLADTIRDLYSDPDTGNGFSFQPYEADAMLAAIRRALDFHSESEQFVSAQRRIMSEDHSWSRSAETYETLFRRAIVKQKGSPSAPPGRLSRSRKSSRAKTDAGP